jgi:hypothetical protein
MHRHLLPLLLLAGTSFVAGTAFADQPHVTYEPVNLVASDGGHTLTGDILIRHGDDVEIAPFLARSNGEVMTPGSFNYPAVEVAYTITDLGGGGTGPGGGFHIQGDTPDFGGSTQIAPWIVGGAVCATMYGITRSWCSFDCRHVGVSHWGAGACGATATCHCNQLPPPRPPTGRPTAWMGSSSPFVLPFTWSNYFVRP